MCKQCAPSPCCPYTVNVSTPVYVLVVYSSMFVHHIFVLCVLLYLKHQCSVLHTKQHSIHFFTCALTLYIYSICSLKFLLIIIVNNFTFLSTCLLINIYGKQLQQQLLQDVVCYANCWYNCHSARVQGFHGKHSNYLPLVVRLVCSCCDLGCLRNQMMSFRPLHT